MATISFLTNGFEVGTSAASGVGFYGSSGFGYSVPVGEYQSNTYITDSTGTSQGVQGNNCKYNTSTSVVIGTASSGVSLTSLPNHQSTLNVRFTHGSAVQTQNGYLRAYDRVGINNNPSGVTVQACNIIHPTITQSPVGSGSSSWTQIYGSGSKLSLVSGPGISGLSPNGTSTSSTQHDWYVAMSVSPTSVGSKTFAAYVEMEYL